ncbi:hypothetical protein LJC68_07960 [Bacteroidales bacterium OttesenSCG-928-B11]|nr:hypothetical protein [Bacteroidales bacterium OttesenSCG-928-C03]MDL2312794.1 hypothetical protein [Bacteroidales bacterium OttesenSCG-928-B11]MDL2325878.1 hypothetical protein [Bacteroidales bacterium OttesenSCG-928-A14]
MKTTKTLLLLAAALLASLLQAQSFQWSHHIGAGENNDDILDSFVDENDNTYYLVYFDGCSRNCLDDELISVICTTLHKPYDVRVPQTGTLPPTSFRFHLAMDTLVLS